METEFVLPKLKWRGTFLKYFSCKVDQRKWKMISNMSSSKFFFWFAINVIAFSTISTASPAKSPETCGLVECKASSGNLSDSKFHITPGGIYNYMYTVNGTILIDGGIKEQSGLHFSANITFHFLTACDGFVYMKDVELWQSVLPSGQDDIHKHHFTHARTSQTFKESLEQFPLRFSFVDGRIDEICPEPEEASWVLNIKRGLLSAFQNTMKRLDLETKSFENDVNGRCGVEYRIGEATSSTLTILKIKDMNSCSDKYGKLSAIQGSPYNFISTSIPVIDSHSECSQVVDRNLIVEVECQESHRLRAMSDGVSGVHVNLRQHLDLITVYTAGANGTEEETDLFASSNDDEDDGFGFHDEDDEDEDNYGANKPGSKDKAAFDRIEDAGTFLIVTKQPDAYMTEIISNEVKNISRRELLSFHHDYHIGSISSDYKTTSNSLVKLCQAVKNNVDSSAGELWEKLVLLLRGMNTRDMLHLSREATQLCDGDRSPFDTVLEAVGTAASVGVIKDRIFSGDAPRERISSWINSLTFIPKPDLDLMVASFPILRARDNYPGIMLSYSSLAHSFCRQHPDCSKHQPVQILSMLYEKFFNLTGCVTKQRKNVDQVLICLKGIGNFGKFDKGIETALETCIQTNDRSEIRVAAIEAYRRMPCANVRESQVESQLGTIFENEDEDSEVRIAAFVTLMRCPTYSRIRWLKRVMGKEQVRQVTSFVSSYMRNLQETSLPSKLELQGLVADEKFNDPYHTDFRQFSKNFEASAFYPDGNFGMGLESNLIFSQASYIPRSTSLNITVDLFGESVNLFEATVRLESFEHYIESFFGHNGTLGESSSGISKFFSSLRRDKRAVPNKRKMRTLAVEYDAQKRYYRDPIMSLSLRTLGNEIAFNRNVGLDRQKAALDNLNPFKFLKNLANQKDSNWQMSMMLFDSSYIIPTGVGLPLNLSAQASSIMRLQAESMIDTANFRASPFQLKLKGKVAPSALITASAGVSLSAYQSHAGMKVRAQLRSSTALEGHVEVARTELVDVAFGVPKSKLELVEFKSEILFLQREDYQTVGEMPAKLSESCNTGLLYKYMGLKMCSSSHFSSPIKTTGLSVSSDDHPPDRHTLWSSLSFLLTGPSHASLSVEKANPNLLKARFHYQWNNNETSTDFKLRTIRTTGSQLNSKEDELGILYRMDKTEKTLGLSVNFPGSKATVNGKLQPEKLSLDLEVVDKAAGTPYIGLNVNLDNNKIENDDDATNGNGLGKTYSGSGTAFYKGWEMNLALEGFQNTTHFSMDSKGTYKPGGSRSAKTEEIAVKLTLAKVEKRRYGYLLDTTKTTMINVEFSQNPDYNTLLIWKSQINEDGYQNDVDFRQGKNYLTVSDPSTFRIQGRAHHEANHKKRAMKWTFIAMQPSQETDWGVEASFNSHGKSFDSAISFRYAPGKTYGTSFSLERKPGVMLFLDSRWNLTIPASPPLQVILHIDERAPRIYEIQYKMDWFGTNHLNVNVELTDRSRRTKTETSIWLTLSTKTINAFKLGIDFLTEERETKLQLKSEYENSLNSFEVGHTVNGGSKHKLYTMVQNGETVYLVMSEVDFEHGVQLSLQTDLGPNFSAFQVRVKATNQNGLRQAHFSYNWDRNSGMRDTTKQFLFEVTVDSSKPLLHRFEGTVTYPGYNYFCEGHYSYGEDDRSRVVMVRLKWKDEEHLHVNAQLVPRISDEGRDVDHEAYDVLLEVVTPFEYVKNVSVNAGIQLMPEKDQCLITIAAKWGTSTTIQGQIESRFYPLEQESPTSLENVDMAKSRIPFKFTLQANLTSTLAGLETITVSLQHLQYNSVNCKTDVDIKLPNGKEISVASRVVVPFSITDILSTQMELHIKTPFIGFQNLDAQAVLGRKEDKDVIALIGIYIENIQYALTITGTPRFEEDGAIGFELTTSNSKYDKIFGSFDYNIGDNSRLACQLGWPQVVIGLEAGLESGGWNEFQVYLTFSSPWMPVKNINTRAKIDSAQFAEIKLELNEDGINARSDWVIESWASFDIRLEGSTPFTAARTFGGVLKNQWDYPSAYHTEMMGWVETRQAGFKLEGGSSEQEKECGFANIWQTSFEMNTVVYPPIRVSCNLVAMGSNYSFEGSILLREGPINVRAEVEVLDVFRFNEKIRITTPYPGLFQLDIDLNPAIVRHEGLYNLGAQAKWRSGSDWDEGGLTVRYGPQSYYSELLIIDMENRLFERCTEDEPDYESPKIDVPQSQLLYFHSPLNWARVVKLEYQLVSLDSGGEEGSDTVYPDENTNKLEDQFPLQHFTVVYQAANVSLSCTIQNEAKQQSFRADINIPTWSDRLSMELHSSLDQSEVERKLSIRGISRHPSLQEYSIISQWNNQLPQYLSGSLEVSSPIEKLEQQSASLMYAHNEKEKSYTADVELVSVTFDKLATNVVLQPGHFSMTLNTPVERYKEVEVRADTKDNEGSPDVKKDTLIVYKNGEDEVEIDIESEIVEGWPSKITGTISATLGSDTTEQGTLSATSQKLGEHKVNGLGEVLWQNGKQVKANVDFDFPIEEHSLKTFRVEVSTTSDGSWKIDVNRVDTERNTLEYSLAGLSPVVGFEDWNGEFLIDKEDSWLAVKAVKLHGKASNGSFAVDSSWLLDKWNNFDVNVKSKYNMLIGEDARSSYELFQRIPLANSFGLSVGNKIPTLSRLTVLDSKLRVKIQDPFFKVGQSIQINYKPEQSPTSTFKSSTAFMSDTTNIDVETTFHDDSHDFGGTAKLEARGSSDHLYMANWNCVWDQNGESFDAAANAIWGSEALGNTSIHSTFNCSVNEASEGILRVRIGSPVVRSKQNDSQQETGADGEIRQGESEGSEGIPSTTTLANPLVNPMVKIDGTFNKISKRHSARIQIGQSGSANVPLVTEAELYLAGLKEFEIRVNFTSNSTEEPGVGLAVGNTVDEWDEHKCSMNGIVGGHWKENEASIKYSLKTAKNADSASYDVSLFGVVPFSTESVAKPQRVGLDMFYKTQVQNWETSLRGEYNGVQLLRTSYKFGALSRAGIEKENTQLELDNHFWPFGFNHTYVYEYSGGSDGNSLPTTTNHFLDLYNLHNATFDRLEGVLRINSNFTGERYAFQVTHPTRKIYLITDYDIQGNQLLHSADLSWKEQSNMVYHLVLTNATQDTKMQHGMSFKLNYPHRVIHLDSGYTFINNNLEWTTSLNLNASRTDEKLVSTVVLAWDPEKDTDTVGGKTVVTLKHPKLNHDMIAAGELTMVGLTATSSSPGRGRIEGIFSLEYSDDPTQRLILNWDAKLDLSKIVYGLPGSPSEETSLFPYWQLETNTKLHHLATNLDLKGLASTVHSPHELSIITMMDFKNSVINDQLEYKMAFELLKESREATAQISDPEGYALLWGQLTGQYPEFVVNGKWNVTGINPSPTANISVDFSQPYFKMYAVHGKDLMDGIFGEGSVVDSRNAFFDISQSHDNFRFSDVNFFVRLNHSRLITSKLEWRPELFAELRELCVNLYKNGTKQFGVKWDKMCGTMGKNMNTSLNNVWDQLKPNVHQFLESMQQDTNFSVDALALKELLVDMYTNNELHLRDIHDYVQLAVEEITARIKKSFERYQRDLSNPGKILEKVYAWIIEQMQKVYQHVTTAWNNYLSSSGEGITASLAKLRQLFYLYLNDTMDLAERLIAEVYENLSNFASDVYIQISHLVERYQPLVMKYVHEVEAAVYSVINKILDFFYETKQAVQQSPYYQKLEKLVKDMDAIFTDISKNDLATNFQKYFGILKGFMGRKIKEICDLRLSLGNAGEKLEEVIKIILETEVAQDLQQAFYQVADNVKFLIEYTELDELASKIFLTLLSKGNSMFFWTAIDTAASFQQAKTKFYFEPKVGILSLEQKLPMPMAAFNETPDFTELPEYKTVTKVKQWLQGSNQSYWKLYKNVVQNPANFVPPFEGHAMLLGSTNFFTFDGLIYNHIGRCVHLLTADLVDGNFSVSLQFEPGDSSDADFAYNIIVASGHNTLIIDMKEDGIKDAKRQQTVSLPIQMNHLQGYRQAETLIVHSPKGLTVSCNSFYQLCQIKVSGWYSRKVAGVLGTMDMEPSSDLILPNRKRWENVSEIFQSWSVPDEQCSSTNDEPLVKSSSSDKQSNLEHWCTRLFKSTKYSSLHACFSTVSVDPFLAVCLASTGSGSNSDSLSTPAASVCQIAKAYAAQCRNKGVHVAIPSSCIKCEMDGETMLERDMKVISSPPEGSPVYRSTDVVLIAEAKECNKGLRSKVRVEKLTLALEDELEKNGFKHNRYAAVVYGGDGVFNIPHEIIQNGKTFSHANEIGSSMSTMTIGNGNNDTFSAIWYALQNLVFRPGVSKTFILFPCSTCNPHQLSIDYSAIHYAMLEQDAKLHIMMNKDFFVEEKMLAKNLFGFDSTFGYLKSDGVKPRLKGDARSRQQVFLPKRLLGYCAPLALETNGTIFTGKKLYRDKMVDVFTKVFSRRVVKTAIPADCQKCYCIPNGDSGIGKINCFVCNYPRYKPLPDDYDDTRIIPQENEVIPEEDNEGTEVYDDDDLNADEE